MFKAISTIFSPKKLGDSVINGIDKTFFTNEERANKFEKLLELYEPYKIAQRILAIVFCIPFVLIYFISFVIHVFFLFLGIDTEPLNELNVYRMKNDTLGNIILMIIGFYFAGGVIEGTVKRLKKKSNS